MRLALADSWGLGERNLKCDNSTGGTMKAPFVVPLAGLALGFALPAFADEEPTATSST
jgi:hypothetical protein